MTTSSASIFEDSRLLYGEMLKGKTVTLTIKSVKPCEIVGEAGRKDKGHEIAFEETGKVHQFSCATNKRALSTICGTDDYTKWSGKKVAVFPFNVNCKGTMVQAVRDKAAKGGAE